MRPLAASDDKTNCDDENAGRGLRPGETLARLAALERIPRVLDRTGVEEWHRPGRRGQFGGLRDGRQ